MRERKETPGFWLATVEALAWAGLIGGMFLLIAVRVGVFKG